MRILHSVENIDPAYGGPTRSVKGLCRALSDIGEEVVLFAHSPRHEMDDPHKVRFLKGTSLKWETARQEIAKVLEEVKPDVLHVHGLWRPVTHIDIQEAKRRGIPVVMSPRGMLDTWALKQKWLKKKIALWLYQEKDLRAVDLYHVTAGQEKRSVEAHGLKQPCCISPNGVTLPKEMPPKSKSAKRTAIFLSRIHPGKGLLTLAEAWARVGLKFKDEGLKFDWKMKVVGPDSYGHKTEVIAKLTELGILNQWEFVDMLSDTEKWSAYRGAELLIHPSVSENFGITIAEGLAAELPVICTKGAPWGDLVSHECGWWIEQGVDALAEALQDATSKDEETLVEMGRRGRELIDSKYTWEAAAKSMCEGYKALVSEK